ncbi:MAG: carboxymuconolactone decarboxylase family protein [Candidatus Micrarchaeota archaeon]|nr:carboxymuconolactone decarboxylase family protein [Candidatus Micrarchaeota archaeon]
MTDIKRSKDEPFLAPIEEPEDPEAKKAYAMMRQYFGKVLTPAKVLNARLPWDFYTQFYGQISQLDRKLELNPETVMLIRQRIANLNLCLFCIDSNRAGTIAAHMDQAKFDALDKYGTSPLFTEAERAALDYVTELTKDKKVDPETFKRLSKHYSDREACEIVYLVASEHVYNLTNIGLNIHSDMICDIIKKRGSP